jgi:hypothetical protein
MTFASTERAYYEPPEDIDCACDRGGDDRRAEDAADAAIDQEQMRREDEDLNGPGPRWEP